MKQVPVAELIDALQSLYGLEGVSIRMPEDGLEGNTYIVTTGTKRFVAKLYDDRQRAETIARFQYRLKNHHLPVPDLLKTTSGDLVAVFRKAYLAVSDYVEGGPLGWNADSAQIKSSLSSSLANAIARMHNLTHTIDTGSQIDHSLSANSILKQFENSDETKYLQNILIEVRQSIIHGDLARENIFLTSDRKSLKAFIDFGDAHFDFITYDIATLLTQVYVTKTWGIDFAGIQDFLASYNKYNELSAKEKRSILPLMILRNQGLLAQIENELEHTKTNHETLESISKSLQAKLVLLAEHQQRLDTIIFSS